MGRARKDVASSLFLYFVFQDFALSILLRPSELLRLVLDKMSFCLSKAVVTHTSIRTKERKKNGRRVRHFWFCGFVLGGKETKILSRPQVETGRKKLKKMSTCQMKPDILIGIDDVSQVIHCDE